MSASDVPVVVVGGGPGGLTLACVLQRGGVPVVVLERDPSPDARVRGGPLDLHADSGQIAVRAAGRYDAWRALARSEDELMTIRDRHGTTLLTLPPSPDGEGNPEIDRTQLRDLLRDALAPGTVIWGAAVDEIVSRADGRREVRWAGGSVVADLVVGADGAWSRVRPLVSPATPGYSGVTFVEFLVPGIDDDPELAALYGRGSTMAQGPLRGLGLQRLAEGGAWGFAGLRVPEAWGDDLPADDPDAVRTILRAAFEGWSPRLLALLDAGEPPFTMRRIRALPVGHSWPATPGVTLVGDAAHVMSPFGGQGANLAMLDAADLGAALVAAGPGGAEGAVAAYEATMIPRAAEAAEMARIGIERSLDENAPASSLAYLSAVTGVEPAPA